MNRYRSIYPLLTIAVVSMIAVAQPQELLIDRVPFDPPYWTQLGGVSSRSTTPIASGAFLSTPRWSSTGDGSVSLSFTPQAGVVADDLHVYAVGHDQQFSHTLGAFDRSTGELAWTSGIPFTILDSWSTPAIDLENNTVILGAGFAVVGVDRFTGDPVWSIELDRPVVNASPCVTDDLGGSDRVFITDYSFGSGGNGMLLCINIDPVSVSNPYAPGDLVRSVELPGDCSGNTPSYLDGVVYVSTADNGSGGAGHVLAFDATSTSEPEPIWDTANPSPFGFYSAVTVSDGSVFASSYNFAGLQRSANTIKLDALSGEVLWSIPTVRTDASPIILPSGDVLISGGVPTSAQTFFTGSLPAIELIDDQGTSAVMLWDSFEQTHEDLNSSGGWDPGEPFLSIGGWGHHPVVFRSDDSATLLVGTMDPPTSSDPFSHAGSLLTIDLGLHPTDPSFVVSTQPGVGTTPAIIGNQVFTTSSDGIHALSLSSDPAQTPITERVRLMTDGRHPIHWPGRSR